ncbi:MAG: right-handed parallel beta-helix repeat-containing protein [Kiritimatiellae bacterium]|nr:right-handed parallel beta-helix repeat-containing protein [Kiritimatiellia bacterium]
MTKTVLQVKPHATSPCLRLRSASLLALVASAMTAFPLLAGNVYYVDANRGDNTYDGSQPEPEGGDSKVGPRKTLNSVMKLTKANNGDVVYAAPGEYKTEGSGSFRVQITAGTKLIATGLATETFIIGDADHDVDQDVSPYGCGPNAVRCVNMAENSSLVGFTVCGGRALGFADTKWGAGIIADNSNNVTVVDCIISNNVAGRAAGLYGGVAVRCELAGNRASKSGPHAMRASLYNCYCHDALGGDVYPVYQCTIRNCDV